MRVIKYIELFAGVGGFSAGIKRAGVPWRLVWFNQYEPGRKAQNAHRVMCEHFGVFRDLSGINTTNYDIRAVNKNNIPEHDLIVGGFPCQDYSVANANAAGISGKKGALFWQIIDTINAKRSQFLLLENVDRLLRSPKQQRGADFAVILSALHEAGYNVQWSVINAADYGEPQRRRRLYLFVYRNGLNIDRLFYDAFNAEQVKTKTFALNGIGAYDFFDRGVMVNGNIQTTKTKPLASSQKTLRSCLQADAPQRYYIKDVDRWRQKKAGKPAAMFTTKTGETYKYTEGALQFPDDIDAPARTILTGEGSLLRTSHVIQDPKTKQLRTLTPLECERLQAFDDNWTASAPETNRRFLMGNAVNVNIIKLVAISINDIIQGL